MEIALLYIILCTALCIFAMYMFYRMHRDNVMHLLGELKQRQSYMSDQAESCRKKVDPLVRTNMSDRFNYFKGKEETYAEAAALAASMLKMKDRRKKKAK